MKSRSGFSVLDIVILILIVGVIAALVIPKTRLKRKEQAEINCRERMTTVSEAMLKFFTTGGDTMLLPRNLQEETADDTLAEAGEETAEEEAEEEEEEMRPHLFTDDMEELAPYLPDTFKAICPLDGEDYVIHTKDSVFYSISCPNGHGQIIKGQATWED